MIGKLAYVCIESKVPAVVRVGRGSESDVGESVPVDRVVDLERVGLREALVGTVERLLEGGK